MEINTENPQSGVKFHDIARRLGLEPLADDVTTELQFSHFDENGKEVRWDLAAVGMAFLDRMDKLL